MAEYNKGFQREREQSALLVTPGVESRSAPISFNFVTWQNNHIVGEAALRQSLLLPMREVGFRSRHHLTRLWLPVIASILVLVCSLRAEIRDRPKAGPPVPLTIELVLVDNSLPEWEKFTRDLPAGVRAVALDVQFEPIERLAEVLASFHDLRTIHLLSHGSPGTVHLGSNSFDINALHRRHRLVEAFNRALHPDGQLILYGCQIAQGHSGARFVEALASKTGIRVGASTTFTGPSSSGADWVLEYETAPLAPFGYRPETTSYAHILSTIPLSGKNSWVAIMFGLAKDPQGDSQAGAADTDIVGDNFHGSFYTAYDDNGTALIASDDSILFRLRIDNPTGPTTFSGVAVVGIEANGDNRIDMFMTVDGRNNGQVVQFYDPGTGFNTAPSTTSTAPIPSGWLPNNGIYPFTSDNYSAIPVSVNTDSHWNSNTDVGGDGTADSFVSFRIPMSDLAIVLSKPSPVDRDGNYGPRGATGIAGFTKDTPVRYVSFTQTQTSAINGDLNGVGRDYDKNMSLVDLGAVTGTMTAANPVADGPFIVITEPISGGVLNDAEDNSVTIAGTTAYLASRTLTLTVTDGTSIVTGTTTTAADGTWTVTGLDLSTLNDGTLTFTATADPDNNAGTANNVIDTATVLHDKTPPLVTITQLSTTTAGTPTISGTSDLPAGSIISITIDADNDNTTTDLSYQVTVSGGAWTLDIATVSPISGTLASGGLTSYAKITAAATDAAGNIGTATSLNRPTVNALSTNDTTPVLSGKWTKITGDVLTITVSGATYTLTPTGNTWSVDLGAATPSSGTLTALTAGTTYEVVGTVTRGASSVTDTTTLELSITTTPVKTITIDGGATATGFDTTPLISGTSQNAGGFVIVRLDPPNTPPPSISDAVSYSVATAGDGSWSLDTGSATPISGTVPVGGYLGAIGIHATDSTGTVSADQVLTISTPTITIGSIVSNSSANSFGKITNIVNGIDTYLNINEDDSITVSGTASSGFTVNLLVSDPSGNTVATNNLAVTGGSWSATLANSWTIANLDNGTLTFTATLSGTAFSASNNSVTHDKTPYVIYNTSTDPLKRSSAEIVGDTDLPVGTLLTVEILVGATSKAKWTSVAVATGGSFTTVGATLSSGSVNLGSGTTAVSVEIYSTSETTDLAGNITQKNIRALTVSPSASTSASVAINTIAGDDTIVKSEILSGLAITGTTSLSSGTVTNILSDGITSITNSATFSSTSWTVNFTKAELQSLGNGQLTASASIVTSSVNISDVRFPILSLTPPSSDD